MQVKSLIAAIAIFAATGSAFAQQTEFKAPDAGFHGKVTRAQVRAELEEAYKNGWRQNAQTEFGAPDAGFHGKLTRAQVRAETDQGYNRGWRQNAQTEFADLVVIGG